MSSTSSAVASSRSERQVAMSPAATTSAGGVGSESEPQAMRRTAKVVTMRPYRDPPTSSDASDQLPVTHRYKVSEGAPGCPDVYCVVG